ncbi:endonuclease/exonuclease/phosphatase family protein [Lacticaseibacillus parakribbianus]|uniref:endonuclease/exonuclease/phosphatase family protein n=1 Tax=Lacticaseibacillus parakribbianus TaxID=2970927 RepID=UPI0021CB2F57|nr:endonuclease/exonuclease/phosphatase family protein [Lacticaseibacillus parakribbianus]
MKLRVATLNIAGGNEPDLTAITRLCERERLDLVGLQEVDRFTKRADYDMAALLAGTTFDYRFAAAMPLDGGEYGIATLANGKLADSSVVSYPTHGLEPRVYQRSVFAAGDRQLAVYNTHLSFETPQLRRQQAAVLMAAVQADPLPVVVFGDFNTDQSRSEWAMFDPLRRVNGDCAWYDSFIGQDQAMKVMSIDNIMMSSSLNYQGARLVPTILSDHRMLEAELLLD